jgi:Lipase (class 3)
MNTRFSYCSLFSLVIIVVATETATATVKSRDVSSSSTTTATSTATKRRMAVTIPNIRDDILTAEDAWESFRLWQSTFMKSPIMFSSSTSKIQNYMNISTSSSSSYETIYQNHQLWIGKSTTNAIDVSNHIWIVIHSDSKTTSAQNVHNQQKQVFLGLPGQEFLHPIFPEEFINNHNKKNNILQRQVLVHEGYHNEMFHNQDMYPKIMEILQPWIDTSKTTTKNTNTVVPLQIHWIGTSIGGAMAMLAGTYFAYHHPTIPTYVRTYRQPRCGNQAFAALVGSIIPNLNVWRIVYQHDWETQQPFQSQYYHTGHLVWRRQQQQVISNTKDSKFQTEAYFRTMGNPALGYAGIQDYSIWSKYTFIYI